MRTETIITIDVTPRRLREIASEMERNMEKAYAGQECPSHTFYGDFSRPDRINVRLMADQGAYHDHKSGNKSKWT